MKISQNFDIREFIPKAIWDKFGKNSTWYVNPKAPKVAEFYKSFFTTFYKNKLGNDKVKTVLVVINTWSYGGEKQWSGLRLPEFKSGATFSQHRFMNAFDCEFWIVFNDGTKQEVDYKEIHQIIQDNEVEFLANGVSCIEHVDDAPGWLHTDFRWIPDQKNILVVRA